MPSNKNRTPQIPLQIPRYTRKEVEEINQVISSHLNKISQDDRTFEKAELSKQNLIKGYRLPAKLQKELLATIKDKENKEDFREFFAKLIFFTDNKKKSNKINLMIYGRLRRLGKEFHNNTEYFTHYRKFNCSNALNTPLLIHENLNCICILPTDINTELKLQDYSEDFKEKLKSTLIGMFNSLPRVWPSGPVMRAYNSDSESEERSSDENRGSNSRKRQKISDDEDVNQNFSLPEYVESESVTQDSTTSTFSNFHGLNDRFKRFKTTLEETTKNSAAVKQDCLSYRAILNRMDIEVQNNLNIIKNSTHRLVYGFETPQMLIQSVEQQTQQISDLSSSQTAQKENVLKLTDTIKLLQTQIQELSMELTQAEKLENITTIFSKLKKSTDDNNLFFKRWLKSCERQLATNNYDLLKVSFALAFFIQEIDKQLESMQPASTRIQTSQEAGASQSQPLAPTATL